MIVLERWSCQTVNLSAVFLQEEHEEYCSEQYTEGAGSWDDELSHHLHVTSQRL